MSASPGARPEYDGVMYRLATDHPDLPKLFAGYRPLVAVTSAVLQGKLGAAWAAGPGPLRAARLDLGCYSFFGGDPSSDAADALARSVKAPIELLYTSSDWRQKLLDVHGARPVDRPMEGFTAASLDPEHLRRMAGATAPGYVLAAVTPKVAEQIDKRLEPHGLQTHDSPETWIAATRPWGAFTDSEGRLVSLGGAYAQSDSHVEVAISTRSAHRGRGLAAMVAARFCLQALDAGLIPCWNASNPISKRLALRLGFRSEGEMEILYLPPEITESP